MLITSHDRRFVDTIAQRYVLIHQGGLIELNDPNWFYHLNPAKIEQAETSQETVINTTHDSDEATLERILEIEQLLDDDLARKSKFQKPKLQQKWKEELAELNGKLK